MLRLSKILAAEEGVTVPAVVTAMANLIREPSYERIFSERLLSQRYWRARSDVYPWQNIVYR